MAPPASCWVWILAPLWWTLNRSSYKASTDCWMLRPLASA